MSVQEGLAPRSCFCPPVVYVIARAQLVEELLDPYIAKATKWDDFVHV